MCRAFSAVLTVLLIGTVGFSLTEPWDPWMSLYFTLVTVTTVGYGDYGLTLAGQRFATVLLLGGIGVATYSFGQIVTAAIDYQQSWRSRMSRQIERMADHVIVCGLGRIGMTVCARLEDANVAFVGVDTDEAAVHRAEERGWMAVVGDATDDDVLRRLAACTARGLACVTDSDTENIVITLSARELNPGLVIISRADQEDTVRKIKLAGASHVISPVQSGGHLIADTILSPNLAEVRPECGDGGLALTELAVGAAAPFAGRTLAQCGAAHPGVVFVALKPGTGSLRVHPPSDHRLEPADILIVAGAEDTLGAIRRDLSLPKAA